MEDTGTRLSGLGLTGTLLVGAAMAVATAGATVVLAHTASARSVDSIFVTPGAPPVPPQPQVPTGSPAPDGVAPPLPDPAPPLPDQGGHLDDGMVENPGQPVASQDPHSNG